MERKVVLVTGASSGIGKAIGLLLAEKGYTVYGTSRKAIAHQDFTYFQMVQLDVHHQESITAAITKIIAQEGRLDVLVNNAGVGITGPIEETPIEEIQKAFDTNFYGAVRTIKAVLPQMRKQNAGLVINITSIAGYMGLPYRGIYSASKSALLVMTEALRMEIKDFGIHVTNLAPGDIATNIAAGRYHAPVLKNSPYAAYERSLKMMDEHVDGAMDASIVAKKVLRIIQKKNPKVHYEVGDFMQKFSLFLKRILPDKVYEKLLLNHYKL
ncbi:MAG: SDR family oxidoreductase [Croceitalea sp.]|nr:SDR family oxidoreductase [Croceitalea sp.]NNC35361.1 SDR family oxidoreductase [Croceitalea sp.]NNM18089.1 SDR family oxidoreductase [Croceitalea sp.]